MNRIPTTIIAMVTLGFGLCPPLGNSLAIAQYAEEAQRAALVDVGSGFQVVAPGETGIAK